MIETKLGRERTSFLSAHVPNKCTVNQSRERATAELPEGVKHGITKLAETKIRNTLGTGWCICGFLESVVPRGG